MLKKGNRLHQQLSTRKKIVREIDKNISNYCFNFLFLFKKMEDLFMLLERYINEKKLRYIVKEVSADELCVTRSFQERFKICYLDDVTIEEVTVKLRSEVLHNYKLYSEFSCNEVNILTELDNSLKNPLKCYNHDTVDLFVTTRINAELLFMNPPKVTHGLTICNNKTQYQKVLYFAKTELSHLDLVVDSKKIRNHDLFTESFDSKIEITKVVSAGEPNNNNPTEVNNKQEDISEIQITKVIPANEQKPNIPTTEIDIKEENILENYTSNTRTLTETKPDVSRKASSKMYISELYWEEEKSVFANNFPYGIDDKCVYVLPINKSKRFDHGQILEKVKEQTFQVIDI